MTLEEPSELYGQEELQQYIKEELSKKVKEKMLIPPKRGSKVDVI